MRPRVCALALALALSLPAAAEPLGFAAAFEAARRYDAPYQAAGHELAAAQQGEPIARAAMLPSVVLNASSSDVRGRRQFANSLNQEVRVPLDYSTPQGTLQLRMPIFNYEGVLRTKQARVQALGAEASYEFKGLDLADRLGGAYLQVLLSIESVTLARAEIASLEAQAERAVQRLQRGTGTRTDVAQVQAQLEVARVRRVDYEDQLVVARRQLQRITGVEAAQLQALPTDYLPTAPAPETLGDWLRLAEQHNPLLRARAQSIEVARLGVQRMRANHLPRLDLVASMGQAQNESISSLSSTSTTRAVGVQLTVPIYSGGGVEASVKQALSEQARAEEDLRAERENLQLEIQRQFAAVRHGRSKVQGYVRAVEAGEVLQQGMTRALAAGLATHADVLDAQTRLFSARRDAAQARYEFLLARLRLAVLAGLPVQDPVDDTDRQLSQSVTLPKADTP